MLKVVRTTIMGGVVFLLPIAVLVFLVGRIVSAAREVVEPVSKQLPVTSFAGVSVAIVLAVLGLVLVSFLAGLFARTQLAKQVVSELETRLLGRVPAYGLLKSMSTDLAGEEQGRHPVVLVDLGEAWQLGIKMGVTRGGSHAVVFMPDSPTPQTGAVLVVAGERIYPTDLPLRKALAAMSSRGLGLAEQL